MSSNALRLKVAAALVLTGVVLSGCASGPQFRGVDGGRIATDETTYSEATGGMLSFVETQEFADDAAEHLVLDLTRYPEFQSNPYRYMIVAGTPINNTGGMLSSDRLEMFQDRLWTRLTNSDARDYLMFLARNRNFTAAAEEEYGAADTGGGYTGDPMNNPQQPRGNDPRNNVDPRYQLLMTTTVTRSNIGRTNAYIAKFEFVRRSNGEIVWSSPGYEAKRIDRN